MRKYLIGTIVFLLVVAVIVTPVIAGGGQFSATFKIGSLIAQGYAWGYGNTDVYMVLNGDAVPVVTCTSPGGNTAPGQNPPHLNSSAKSEIAGLNTKNGKTPYYNEAQNPDFSSFTPSQLGCPNNNWTATINYIAWDGATITMTDLSGNTIVQHTYSCTQTSTTTITCRQTS